MQNVIYVKAYTGPQDILDEGGVLIFIHKPIGISDEVVGTQRRAIWR